MCLKRLGEIVAAIMLGTIAVVLFCTPTGHRLEDEDYD